MPVGAAQTAFAAAAIRDGIVLTPAKVPWINQQGHFGLPDQAGSARRSLSVIFDALGGVASDQTAKRTTALRGDFYHEPSRTFIETDESQHFTSFRLKSLELYPVETRLGFDLSEYLELCRTLAPTSDKYFAAKDAKGFGSGGRQRQRAYNDALRDLAIPAMGHPAVIRVPILDADGETAYLKARDSIRFSLGC